MNEGTARTVVVVTYVAMCVSLIFSLQPQLRYKVSERLKLWQYNFSMMQWRSRRLRMPTWMDDVKRSDLPEEPAK